MPDRKSQPQALIEEMLAEIRQILDEGQSCAQLPSEATVAPVAPRALTAQPPAHAPRGGARTLEDIVRDLLRPMLRRWFDENLQSLIEREMRAEIRRTAREIDA